ncbi:MAG: exonuclease subunit SbcD, partial [archaeon]|nr:exonuclease subunit SbcD [archaeon]
MGVLKFLHTSDLHIGKKLYGYSLSDDQKHILNEIVRIAKEQKVDGAIIAGDIYDVSAPSEESVSIFNGFVTDLADVCSVFIVPGNHDSAERIGYLKGLLRRSKVYVTGTYKGKAEKIVLEDDLGKLNMFLLPYMRTSFARNHYNDDSIRNPDMAMKVTLDHSDIDPSERNILVAHQFFAGIGVDLEQS